MSSVYVVCCIFLKTYKIYFCIQTNSVDPDQSAQWNNDNKADNNCCGVVGILRAKKTIPTLIKGAISPAGNS